MAEETPAEAPAPAAPKPAKGGSSLVMTLVIVLLSNAAGAGATWYFVRKSMASLVLPAAGEKKEEHVDKAEELEKSAVVPLEPFVVNLADTDAARYLRIKVSLMVDDKEKIKEVIENQALQIKVRDLILQTLSRKTSHDLVNDEGKNKLRHEIQEQVGPYFKEPKLSDVMFTEFVIQL